MIVDVRIFHILRGVLEGVLQWLYGIGTVLCIHDACLLLHWTDVCGFVSFLRMWMLQCGSWRFFLVAVFFYGLFLPIKLLCIYFFGKKRAKSVFYKDFCYLCASLTYLTLNIMKELVEKIQEVYAAFEADANAQVEKGNKAAGTRARKASLELEKMMKSFRKVSLEASKN